MSPFSKRTDCLRSRKVPIFWLLKPGRMTPSDWNTECHESPRCIPVPCAFPPLFRESVYQKTDRDQPCRPGSRRKSIRPASPVFGTSSGRSGSIHSCRHPVRPSIGSRQSHRDCFSPFRTAAAPMHPQDMDVEGLFSSPRSGLRMTSAVILTESGFPGQVKNPLWSG
jgi:hypothetical protein